MNVNNRFCAEAPVASVKCPFVLSVVQATAPSLFLCSFFCLSTETGLLPPLGLPMAKCNLVAICCATCLCGTCPMHFVWEGTQ